MLNKQVCQECCKKYGWKWQPTLFEKMREIRCPYEVGAKKANVNGEPHDRCPFYLEHKLSEKQC